MRSSLSLRDTFRVKNLEICTFISITRESRIGGFRESGSFTVTFVLLGVRTGIVDASDSFFKELGLFHEKFHLLFPKGIVGSYSSVVLAFIFFNFFGGFHRTIS